MFTSTNFLCINVLHEGQTQVNSASGGRDGVCMWEGVRKRRSSCDCVCGAPRHAQCTDEERFSFFRRLHWGPPVTPSVTSVGPSKRGGFPLVFLPLNSTPLPRQGPRPARLPESYTTCRWILCSTAVKQQ